ncbi:hypothetical protein F5887DRAFT_1285508 [Amanita rubescens]|nr:hypothetical protein F5887DRAFT_1285508 [Amanita rubescens]
MSPPNTEYQVATLNCVNGTPSKMNQSGPVVMDLAPKTYGIFTICAFNVGETIRMIFVASEVPLNQANSTVALYLQIGGTWFTDISGNQASVNMTCNIKPQILNVSVIYNNTGYVTLEPLWQTSTYPTSTVVTNIMAALEYHLSITQAPDMNIAIEAIYELYTAAYPSSPEVEDYAPLADLMAAYIQGVIENEATNLRYTLSLFSDIQVPQEPVYAKINETFVFWGAADPKYKLLIVAAPLLIMLSTIIIILVALSLAWPLKWSKNNMSFDPMSIIHLIIACSIGQVDPLQFKGYDKASIYDKPNDVKFGLAEMPRYNCREGLKMKRRGEFAKRAIPESGGTDN